ncbi:MULTISPECIES: toll/interleukin-1 receptor domain-containing protein [Rhodomicrobium]|uniref:toll/interleukin-1 receptor domain-containing protein n=1 Tax=Rhodomicrobium TaxID=1068 RepID=UPI000B4B00E4|nr:MULTISPECIES: toll/interleukin-1 receptor domain-containing protein [Rhodomicrobium]
MDLPSRIFQSTIFLSHQPELESHARDIASSIEARGHRVLRSGRGPSAPDQIERADAFIFLITPQSVAQGTRTMSELQLAQQKWPVAEDHVLPVAVARTKISEIPSYLRSVDILQPKGNLGLDIAARVDRIAGRPTAMMLAAILGLLGAFSGLFTLLLIKRPGATLDSFYIFPGLLAGLVIGFGVWLISGKRWLPALVAVVAVLVAWVCAFGLWVGANGQMGRDALRFFCGALFGAVTLLGLALVRGSLRRLDLWMLTALVGGASWILADWVGWYAGLPGRAFWWVIWQALFSAWIGYWLAQPRAR